MECLLAINNIKKLFPGVIAVNDVSFEIRKGEVHIIIGENGAGKSTLVKMLAGIYPIDGGMFTFEGGLYEPKNVMDAQNKGINMIHQELNLMENRTVAQNIFVGKEPIKSQLLKVVDVKTMNKECKKLLDTLEIDITPTTMVKDLSIAQQQMVEVAKALSSKSKILIMDEPTSSLTQKEIDNLFRITRKLKESGTSIIYISHRMQELLDIGDRVTVMRDGCYMGTRNVAETNMQELISMMVGREIEDIYGRTYNEPGEIALKTDKLQGLRFRNVDIEVRAGEVVGIAGLIGAGRSELVKAIFGYDRIEKGKVFILGNEIITKKHTTDKAVRLSISLIPEDRKTEGVFVQLPIKQNISLCAMDMIFKKGIINNKKEKDIADEQIKKLRIMTTSSDKLVNDLSGGNQQKVVLAKWLVTKSRLFILDEPTRGIDVGAKSEIFALINELAKQGAGILMISSDMPELIGLSDRVYVMKDGEITGELSHIDGDFDQVTMLSLALEGRHAS